MKNQKQKAASKAQKARKLGISRSTLYQWKTEGAPVDASEEKILEWAMEREKRGKGESDDIREARLRVLAETARRLKLANDAREGNTVAKPDVTFAINKGMALLASILDRKFVLEAPPALKGRDEAAICSWLKDAMQAAYAELRTSLQQLTAE